MMKKLYKDLVELPGVSGHERYVRNYVKDFLRKHAEEVFEDKLGSVFGGINLDKDGPTVMIAGHMDEVGAMVTEITDKGMIKMIPIGGINPPVMLSQNMHVVLDDGSTIPGVIGAKPPHLLRDKSNKQISDFKDLMLDVGADSKEHARKMGIEIGQQIVFDNTYRDTHDGKKIFSKAWDNRFGTAMALDVLEDMKGEDLPCRLIAGGNVQEEVGLRGAKTSAHLIKPDVFIAVDCSPCADAFEDSDVGGHLGKGFMVRFYDPRAIMHQGMKSFVVSTAEDHDIPYQYYKSLGGTDAARVQLSGSGVLSCTVGMPARYIHSSTSMIHKDDQVAVKKQLIAMLKALDHEMIETIKANV